MPGGASGDVPWSVVEVALVSCRLVQQSAGVVWRESVLAEIIHQYKRCEWPLPPAVNCVNGQSLQTSLCPVPSAAAVNGSEVSDCDSPVFVLLQRPKGIRVTPCVRRAIAGVLGRHSAWPVPTTCVRRGVWRRATCTWGRCAAGRVLLWPRECVWAAL